MLAAGLNSKVETTGPAYVLTTSPSILKCANLSIKSLIFSSISDSFTEFLVLGAFSKKSILGSLKFFGFSLVPFSILSKNFLFSSNSSTTSTVDSLAEATSFFSLLLGAGVSTCKGASSLASSISSTLTSLRK